MLYERKGTKHSGMMEAKDMEETFRSFLQELEDTSSAGGSGKKLLEKEVLETMHKEGFSDQEIYDMPLKQFLDLFYDAYILKANNILSMSTLENFLKKLKQMLV